MKAQQNSRRLIRFGNNQKLTRTPCVSILLVLVLASATLLSTTRRVHAIAQGEAKVADQTSQRVSQVATNGRIAFLSSESSGSQSDIYTINPDSSDRKQLTFSQESEEQPAWSPDGRKIAFSRYFAEANQFGRSEMFVMNADGSDQRRLTQSKYDLLPTWSPDGTKIAFWRIDSTIMPSGQGVFVMNADGSDQRAVAPGFQGPAWSPDGLKLAVNDNGDVGTYGIYLMNVDGSNRIQITDPSECCLDYDPAWSPDGSKITFTRATDCFFGECESLTLWVVNADGSNPTKLADSFSYTSAWSPDGTKIIFSKTVNFVTDLFVMNPNGSGLTNITNTDGKHEWSPSWQPLSLPNSIDDPRFFVRQHYLDFLNRAPDVPGWDHWTGEITECSDAAKRHPGESFGLCTERKRANTSAAFFLSPEFQNTGSFVLRVHWGTLGKLLNAQCPGIPNALPGHCRPRYNEYLADIAAVGQGIVVNDELDPAVINANKQVFVASFVQRPEFKAIYDSLNNTQYVDKLFQTTGITPSSSDRQALINGLDNGTETRASVVFKVVDGATTTTGGLLVFNTSYGQAFYNQEFDTAFVFMEYVGYLRRNPDQDGYDFWLNKLRLYGNWVDAQMVLAFIISPEYRSRFGPP